MIYADDCRDAFKLYLKARDPESALRNARNALRVISDSGWITKSDHTVDDICNMVGELYGGGYAPAADVLSSEINAELVKHNLPPRFEPKHGKFPTACPQCGGTLPFTYSDVSIICPFCSAVIRAE